MKFIDIINNYRDILTEQDENQAPVASEQDAAEPAPAEGPTAVAPEGYVDLVRLLVKATAMNFPVGALDELYRMDVTQENAFTVQKAIVATLKQYEATGDNQERLENPNYKRFIDSVNPGNFIERLKTVKSIIDNRSPNK